MAAPGARRPEWRAAPPGLELCAGEVHVWRVEVPPAPADLELSRAFLSAEELARAERFHFERDRAEFVVSHATLRRLLARFSGSEPLALRFEHGPRGKPALAGLAPPLYFNLSHSRGLALLALARDGEVGVDVERIDPRRAEEKLAERILTGAELEPWRACGAERRAALFFRAWAAKEALLKATGLGLGLDPHDLAVLDDRGNLVAEQELDGRRWALHPLVLGVEWSAALACSPSAAVRRFSV